MAPKRWTLVVTELGASAVLHQVEVEATNWMAALAQARASIGESGAVPAGASCAVAPDGRVTILDPVAQRTYTVAPQAGGSLLPPKPLSVPAPKSGASSSKAPPARTTESASAPTAPSSAEPRSPALGYIATPLASRSAEDIGARGTSPGSVRPPASASEPGLRSAPPPAAPSASAPPQTPALAAAVVAAPEAVRAPLPAEEITTEWRLLAQRDEEPSSDSPITFRERTYVVPPDMATATVEVILRHRLEELQRGLSHIARGRFVVLAAFDHTWHGSPERPPVAVLEWKDWRGAPSLRFPLSEALSPSPPQRSVPPSPSASARASAAPKMAAMPAPTTPQRAPLGGAVLSPSVAGEDARLAQAFEATEDLFMLRTPAEGVEFTVKLLESLLPAEAITGALYDIDRDELRFVSVTGIAADERRGHAVRAREGLMGAAVARRSALVVGDLMGDDRFDDVAEGRTGLVPRDALYVPVEKANRLLGMLQILNRRGRTAGDPARGAFSDADIELAAYLGGRLADFLLHARASIPTAAR